MADLFMESRLKILASMSFASWLTGSRMPVISTGLQIASFAYSAWYAFLFYKTFKATITGVFTWPYISQILVARYYTREEFFRADEAPEDVVAQREAAFDRMAKSWKERWAKAEPTQKYLKRHFSDLRFKASGFESMYHIWQKVATEAFDPLTVVDHTEGMDIIDTSGERFLDASGSYGVNCFGYTKTKEFVAQGQDLAVKVGPCLGPMHPVVKENVEMLLNIFKKEEVSLHMSGTEAVMSAVYQARFHTERRLTAVFQGSYHGWWDGVMQGAGNERWATDCLVLKDQNDDALELIRLRRSEIASVIVNPVNGFGWKTAGTSKLSTSDCSPGYSEMDKFKVWLHKVRKLCTDCDIPLIFDETWAFHLGEGGAQKLYGIEPDLLVLGKSIGGGHAAGAVLGPSRLMERKDPDRPMRVNFVVGTFKGNPVSMGAMNAALKYVTTPEAKKAFDGLKDRVDKWVAICNKALEKEDLPISVAAHRTTWCICYKQHSSYNFMFMYYLRDAGLQMAWVGTGKMLFTLEFSDEHFKRLTDIIVKAGKAFKADGWWWPGGKKISLIPVVLGPSIRYHVAAIKRRLGLEA